MLLKEKFLFSFLDSYIEEKKPRPYKDRELNNEKKDLNLIS